MSLWLQAVAQALEAGEYERLRVDILPLAPRRLPGCLIREIEFAERRCRDQAKDRLFPIRLLWLLEANEQRLFGLPALGRSRYHPEELLELWKRASADAQYRHELEAAGFLFDFTEMAIQLSEGWVYIGERFVEDFLEAEATLGVELLFPHPGTSEGRPAFREYKHPGSGGESRAEPGAVNNETRQRRT